MLKLILKLWDMTLMQIAMHIFHVNKVKKKVQKNTFNYKIKECLKVRCPVIHGVLMKPRTLCFVDYFPY